MPTLQNVKDKVDAFLADRWPIVRDRQIAYYDAHGRYWQGLKSNINIPAHTTTKYGDDFPDNLASVPTDQVETWMDFLPEIDGVEIPAVLIFDVYSGPIGDGFVATIIAKYNDVIYRRSHNYGPETWKTIGWHTVEVAE